jgi:hypothetical protein
MNTRGVSMDKLSFKYQSGDVVVESSLDAGRKWGDVLNQFYDFLKACGYQLKNLDMEEVVSDAIDKELMDEEKQSRKRYLAKLFEEKLGLSDVEDLLNEIVKIEQVLLSQVKLVNIPYSWCRKGILLEAYQIDKFIVNIVEHEDYSILIG